jgi:hypothetical protein
MALVAAQRGIPGIPIYFLILKNRPCFRKQPSSGMIKVGPRRGASILPDFGVESLVLVGGQGISDPGTGRQIFRHRGFVLLTRELRAMIVHVEHDDSDDAGARQWWRACRKKKQTDIRL